MEQATGIKISKGVATSKTLVDITLWLEWFNFVYVSPLVIAFLPAFVVTTLIVLPGTVVQRVKTFIFFFKWLLAGITALFGIDGKSFDCVTGFVLRNNVQKEVIAKCTGNQYFSDGLAGTVFINRTIFSVFVGVVVGRFAYRYLKKWFAQNAEESLHKMEHFNVISGARILTPAEVMENIAKEQRGEKWQLQ
jgi:hypothetical protein